MVTLAPPSPLRSASPARMPRKLGRKIERYCCLAVSYFPLVFVLGLTTWAVWVEAHIGFYASGDTWWGTTSAILGISVYLLMIWSYLSVVFTSPGYTTGRHGYSTLPSHAGPVGTSLTVKSNGESRYCNKCQARKPDRAHHCSTCNTCVLKMDHHCPWVSNCVGLHNYKAFLLFLIYTTLFCIVDFAIAAGWVYREILEESEYDDSLMPINYIMLAVIAGIIGLVLGGFTGWHISLAVAGQTTIECLEKTKYLAPLRNTTQNSTAPRTPRLPRSGEVHYRSSSRDRSNDRGNESVGEVRNLQTYEALERQRAADRYNAYLDEQDAEKLPNAFDLGLKRNLYHLLGPSRLLWALPICNTVGDGWNWEPSPKWLAARDEVAREREAQQTREQAAGWGPGDASPCLEFAPADGAGRHYVDAYSDMSKGEKRLGRNSEPFTDEVLSMQELPPRRVGPEISFKPSDGQSEAERKALDQKATEGLTRKVGIVTNTILGNTVARQKDDVRGWDGQDANVD